MGRKRRVGILTGGGDVPGLNVAIKAVVTLAASHDIEIVGIRKCWLGTLWLNPDDPSDLNEWVTPLTG